MSIRKIRPRNSLPANITLNNNYKARSQIDRIIHKCRQGYKVSRHWDLDFDPADLGWLCAEAIHVLQNDPMLLRLEVPITVCGDIHGQYYDLLTMFQRCGNIPDTKYLFLGDYVDRGYNSIETITYLLALKVKYPHHIWLLRGNHETPELSKQYGFGEECLRRYPTDELWEAFNNVFKYLPIAAIIADRIFCVHGGLSPELDGLTRIEQLSRPLEIPARGMLSDLVWSDPDPKQDGWGKSRRGTDHYTFGQDAAEDFCEDNGFDLICRAHQVVQEGYEFPFNPNQSVLTVFSAPGYSDEYDDNRYNKGAVLKIDKALQCSFTTFSSIGFSRSVPRTPQPGRSKFGRI